MRFHESVAFVVPVAIDRAVPRTAAVPEGFRLIHWAHLPGGRVTPEFTARVLQLWRGHRERREPAGGGGGGRRTFRVYLSAVSSEFGAARSKVATDLQHRGLLVHSAENFGAGPGTVLHRIHDYVRDCSAVICILGNCAGAIPKPAEVEPFRAMLPATSGEASYAQWELLFARYFHKALYVYMAGPGYVPDAAAPAQDGPDELQAKFINYVKQLGLSRSTFSTADELRILVLRQDWPRVDPACAGSGQAELPSVPEPGYAVQGSPQVSGQPPPQLTADQWSLPAAAVARALCGPAGTGKTRLAVEYAWRYAHDYTALLFVPAKTPEELREHLFGRQGATLLDLPEREADDEKVKADAVLKWLARRPGWLLILDDVDTPEAAGAVMQLLARLQGGHVILTSRLSDWRAPVKPMELGGLARKDAARFLLSGTRNRRREQPSDAADAEALARQLDGLPLAMDLAAAAIARKRLTIAAYLSALREPVSERLGVAARSPPPGSDRLGHFHSTPRIRRNRAAAAALLVRARADPAVRVGRRGRRNDLEGGTGTPRSGITGSAASEPSRRTLRFGRPVDPRPFRRTHRRRARGAVCQGTPPGTEYRALSPSGRAAGRVARLESSAPRLGAPRRAPCGRSHLAALDFVTTSRDVRRHTRGRSRRRSPHRTTRG